MDMNDVKTGAEIVKDSSEALKNFQEIIGKFLISSKSIMYTSFCI